MSCRQTYELSYLERIRLHELDLAIPWLPPKARVLEIGAGSGWQARRLSELGFVVTAIDVSTSGYQSTRVWPVLEYDGSAIPFGASSFDVVFSSNVLEHLPSFDTIQGEIHRVLRPDGLAVHIVPSGAWRFWTNVVHYPFVARYALQLAVCGTHHRDVAEAANVGTHGGLLSVIGRALLPARHGETGGPVTEIYYFSRLHWARLFRRTGWTIRSSTAGGLFYTGYGLFASRLSLSARAHLSRFLGSSCHVFVVQSARSRSAPPTP